MNLLRKARVWLLGAIAIAVSVAAVMHAGGRETEPSAGEVSADAESVEEVRGFFAALRAELDAERAGSQQADDLEHARAMLQRGDALLQDHGPRLSEAEREFAAGTLDRLRARLASAQP